MSASPDFADYVLRAKLVRIEDEIARRGIKLNGRVDRCGPCPKCGGEDRFSINTMKGVWNCRGCGVGGDIIDLVKHLDGVDFVAACETLTNEPPPKASSNGKAGGPAPRKVVAGKYPYEDDTGAVRFVVERIEYQNPDGSYVLTKDGRKRKKTFSQRRPDPDKPGQWIWNVDGVPALLYRLPQINEALAHKHMIAVVEGEAKAELLWLWKVPATCCANGAKSWTSDHAQFLRGADVVILPDNDASGTGYADAVGASLQGIASSVRVLELPGLPDKGDIVDWAATGGKVEQLHELIARDAKPWGPPQAQQQQQQNPPAQAAPASQPAQATPASPSAQATPASQPTQAAPASQPAQALELEVWDAGDDVDPPEPRGWILGNAFCRGVISQLIAAGAAGKTTLRILQALSAVTGRKLTGEIGERSTRQRQR